MEQGLKYEEAMRQLEEIVRKMESDQLDIDSLTQELRRAKALVKLCKDKLTKTDEEISKLLEGSDDPGQEGGEKSGEEGAQDDDDFPF